MMTDPTTRRPLWFSLGNSARIFPPKCKTIRSLSSAHNMPYFMFLASITEAMSAFYSGWFRRQSKVSQQCTTEDTFSYEERRILWCRITIYIGADENVRRMLLFDARRKKEIWRFITYMLIHTDITHLLLNLIIQLLLGIPVELEQGHCKCAAIYFGGGLAGSLGTSNFASFSLMAGASSGIYALLTSHLSNITLNYDVLKYLKYRVFAIVILTMSDVIYIFYHVYFRNNENPQIGWVAHVFGAVFGLILGFLLFKGDSKLKKPLQAASYILLLVFALAIGYNYLKMPLTLLREPS